MLMTKTFELSLNDNIDIIQGRVVSSSLRNKIYPLFSASKIKQCNFRYSIVTIEWLKRGERMNV